jgi:hypothetical protein
MIVIVTRTERLTDTSLTKSVRISTFCHWLAGPSKTTLVLNVKLEIL